MINNTEYTDQFSDIEEKYYQEQESGVQTCPSCGNTVPHEQMTASVTRGVMCWDCDLKLPQ